MNRKKKEVAEKYVGFELKRNKGDGGEKKTDNSLPEHFSLDPEL